MADVNSLFFADFQDGRSTSRYSETSDSFFDLARSNDAISVLDRMQYICDPEAASCFAVDTDLNKFFFDYGHHTLKGAEYFGGSLTGSIG